MSFKDLLSKLAQKANENINNSYQLQKDSGDIMMDRIKMENHPELSGPRLEPLTLFGGATPREKEYMDTMAGGMMGSVGAIPKLIKSSPYMKGITEQVVKKAIPEAEGLAKTGFSHIKEFLAKQKLLNKRY